MVVTMDGPIDIIIHPDRGFKVDEHYECPLKGMYQAEFGQIQQSANMGCPCCVLVHAAINQRWPNCATTGHITFNSHDQPWEQIYVYAPPINGQIAFVCGPEIEKNDTEELNAYQFHGTQHIFTDMMERFAPCDTSSAKSLQTSRQWIKECDEEHRCMQATKPTLPRRVLDLRNDRVRLLEVTNEEKFNRYACLSHCWGTDSENLLRTKSTNMDSFKSEIPFDLLPRTFQDAISFTRQLDVMFLWIDSLCIIQDDELDWQQQSAIMAEIYQNAYVALAATASSSADEGLYTPDNSLKLHDTDKPPLTLVRYQDGSEREVRTRICFNHRTEYFPLLLRGWVYQERLLSPRVLHFAGDELIWECHGRVDCECGGSDDLRHHFSRAVDSPGQVSGFHEENKDDVENEVQDVSKLDDIQFQFTKRWRHIVFYYTQLSLTYPSDIFPALSGIAKAFALKTQDEYVAGLWKRTLVKDLLWYCNTSVLNLNIQPWRAPSWSWAAVSTSDTIAHIHFRQDMEVVKLAEVKDVVCQPSGADPTGELEYAYITLSTKAIPARLMRMDNSSELTAPRYALYFDIASSNIMEVIRIPRLPCDEQTGHHGLSDPRLANGIQCLDVIVVQLARCAFALGKRYRGYPETIEQDVRFCMVIARHSDQGERWIRVGLATFAEYEPTTVQFAQEDGAETEGLFEELAQRNRKILRLFDEVEIRDITIW
jgi:hypothetical protein